MAVLASLPPSPPVPARLCQSLPVPASQRGVDGSAAPDSSSVSGMSTPEHSFGVQAERPAERVLFRALFDDAAVFPPGLTPLPQAVTDHLARQSSSYADLVGPLLLPASAIEDFLRLGRPQQVDVALIGRPGTDLTFVGDALGRLGDDAGVTLSGVEIGWSPDWR